MKLSQIYNKLGLEYNQNSDTEVQALNTLKNASSSELSFFENPKYIDELKNTKAYAVLVSAKFAKDVPDNTIAIVVENPYLELAYLSEEFQKPLRSKKTITNIESSVYVASNVHIGNKVEIGTKTQILSGVSIGDNVTIGKNCIIYPNVVIYNDTKIGNNVRIHANSVVGCDGFGYAHTSAGEHIKIHHNGNVIIEDDVEIGSNTSIDRAVFASTIIKQGCKIDNLVQIAHNVELGEHSIIVSQTGISGSTTTGRNIVMGGQCGTAGHLHIPAFTTLASRTGVTKSIKKPGVYAGFPAVEHGVWLRTKAIISKLVKQNSKK